MKKDEYLSMLIKDNVTADGYQHEINEAIIDCVDIALSQMPASFEIQDTSIRSRAWRTSYDLERIRV